MISLTEFTNHMQLNVHWQPEQQRAAEQAIEWASGLILLYTGRATWTTPPAGVKPIVAAIAGMILKNPDLRTSYSGPEGLSYAGSIVRLLPDDMRSLLDSCSARKRRVGSARMGVAAWMTPDVSA